MEAVTYTSELLEQPTVTRLDVSTTLRNFLMITYAVPPDRLASIVHPRFSLDCISLDGSKQALVSIVAFEDTDFRFAGIPNLRWRFGQTNYRIYVHDRATGRRCVWFIGTTLGSWTVVIPRFRWKLPWHHGRFSISASPDSAGQASRIRFTTKSRWAPLLVDAQVGTSAPESFPGFPDRETAMVVLTHPLVAYYNRRDSKLGTYSVWHPRMQPSAGTLHQLRSSLLDRLGLVPYSEQLAPYNVMFQESIDFSIRLPPVVVEGAAA